MSNQPPKNNNELLKFLAATVEAMHDQMVTKADLEPLATKAELEALRGEMATKAELEALRGEMATKTDLERVESRLGADIARLEVKLEVEATTIRGDIEQVQLRLDSIDHKLATRLDQVEAEVSRLRSVLYLLVKDKPDMLRLLGR